MTDSSVDKMDMSLDDIIKMGGGRGRSGSGGGFRRRGQGFGRGRGGGGGGGQRRNNDAGRGVARGGVGRRRDAAAPYSRPRQVPEVWKHDLYNDSDVPPVQSYRPAEPVMRAAADRRQPKLIISNLDFGVNDQDIEELFAEFGPLKHFAVHYDKSGRSLGTADVEYERLADAVKAMKQYNNVPLDGKPMKIRMEGEEAAREDRPRSMSSRLGTVDNSAARRQAPAPSFKRSEYRGSPNQNRSQGQQRGRGGQGRGGQGRGGQGRGRGRNRNEAPPSKEDLDAELDAYNAKMDME